MRIIDNIQTYFKSTDQYDGPYSCSVLDRIGVKEYSTINAKTQLKDFNRLNDWK